jgi:hypothetical protein
MRTSTLLLSAVVACLAFATPTAAYTKVSLGRCAGFAVMAGTSLASAGTVTVIKTGSIGVAPGTSITGNIDVQDGAVEDNSSAAISCAADELLAYNAAKGSVCPPANALSNSQLGGNIFYPGTYCTSGMFTISAGTIVTLDALGNPFAQWIFQSATSIVTATATSFILQNGANANNVFWQIGSSATIAYSSSFVGIVLAYASVSVDTSATINGRLFAQAAVTFAGGDVVAPPAKFIAPIVLLPSSSSSSSSSTGAAAGIVTINSSGLPVIITPSAPVTTSTGTYTPPPTVTPVVVAPTAPTTTTPTTTTPTTPTTAPVVVVPTDSTIPAVVVPVDVLPVVLPSPYLLSPASLGTVQALVLTTNTNTVLAPLLGGGN